MLFLYASLLSHLSSKSEVSMKKRVLTGIGYAVVLISFYAIKLLVSDYCFDAVPWIIAMVGTFEMARACSLTKAQKWLTVGFAIVNTPLFVVMELWQKLGYFTLIATMIAVLLIAVSSIIYDYQNTTIDQIGKTVLTIVYPNLFLDFLIVINHMDHNGLLLFYPFAITALTDVFAFQFGRWFHKFFPAKLSPVISPNKTVIGAIGGFFGGIASSILLFFIWKNFFVPEYGQKEFIAFIVMGLLVAFVTEVGDLVESAIKRKAGIKDMGNCLPGHGGMLDRFDSALYTTVVTFVVFVLISII